MTKRFIIFTIIVLALLLVCKDNPVDLSDKPVPSAHAVPAWSPDGEWIAIAWHGDPNIVPWNLSLIRPDGTDLHQFPNSENFPPIIDLCWAPDGDWLAFVTIGWNLYKVKSDGDSLTQLTFTNDVTSCTWSYSDTLIAYTRIGNDVSGAWLLGTNDLFHKHLIVSGYGESFGRGDSILYTKSINADSAYISLMDISDSSERLVLKWEIGSPYTTYYDPEVSPLGTEIAFCIDAYIRTITTDGSLLQTLTNHRGSFPHWSPDGSKIVYCTSTINSQDCNLRIMSRDGSDNHVLTDWLDIPTSDSLK